MASKKAEAKKRAQERHAKDAFMNRYNINLTDKMHADLVNQIQTKQAWFLKGQSNRVSVFKVTCEGKTIPVVYDSVRKQIATALPPECLDRNKIGVVDIDNMV